MDDVLTRDAADMECLKEKERGNIICKYICISIYIYYMYICIVPIHIWMDSPREMPPMWSDWEQKRRNGIDIKERKRESGW